MTTIKDLDLDILNNALMEVYIKWHDKVHGKEHPLNSDDTERIAEYFQESLDIHNGNLDKQEIKKIREKRNEMNFPETYY